MPFAAGLRSGERETYLSENNKIQKQEGMTMDIYRFINSHDIREYLESISYVFSPLEAAWLIEKCRTATLKEKHEAWRELLQTMPDVPVEERPWTDARPSLHAFLREYIRFQDDLVAELYSRKENEIYAGEIRHPGQKEIYPFAGCLGRKCRSL